MGAAERKEVLRAHFGPLVEKLGYKFSPDAEIVEFLLDGEVMLEKKHGAPYCPCQGLGPTREENRKIVCPCIPYHREHYDYMKRCWCGLFVHKDVTDPDKLKQIGYKEYLKLKNKAPG
jgi:ferredoxin-thioredoxin reductase catalytic subunit